MHDDLQYPRPYHQEHSQAPSQASRKGSFGENSGLYIQDGDRDFPENRQENTHIVQYHNAGFTQLDYPEDLADGQMTPLPDYDIDAQESFPPASQPSEIGVSVHSTDAI
jgi:hypothetical protein